jgi:hypothetical protein
MSILNRHGERHEERRKARHELIWAGVILLFVGLLFGTMWLLTQLGPRIDPAAGPDVPVISVLDESAVDDLRSQINQQVAQYQQALVDGTTSPLDNLALIDEAIRMQRRILAGREGTIASQRDVDKLDELTAIRDRAMGQFLHAQSVEAERAAEVASTARDHDAWIRHLERALNSQREINRNYGRSEFRDNTRATVLEGRLRDARAQPLSDESQTHHMAALHALSSGNYQVARREMARALQLQRQLLDEHRQSRLASLARLRSYEADWVRVQTAEAVTRIQSAVADAEAAITARQPERALTAIDEAMRLQESLIRDFPTSEFARPDQLAQMRVVRETAASMDGQARIDRLMAELDARLQDAQEEGLARMVADLYRQTSQLHGAFANSRLLNVGQLRRLEYLNSIRTDLIDLRSTVQQRLRPVPGHSGVLMLDTEVWQNLYRRISGDNPSNQIGDSLPVESVNFDQARTFCQQLGWLLGKRVALPTRDQFTAALGSVRVSLVADISWNSQNSDRVIKPVGTRSPTTSGFFDLLGNVAEWLDPQSDNNLSEVLIGGGSVRDNPISLAELPVESRSRSERNRLIGFRVVVYE